MLRGKGLCSLVPVLSRTPPPHPTPTPPHVAASSQHPCPWVPSWPMADALQQVSVAFLRVTFPHFTEGALLSNFPASQQVVFSLPAQAWNTSAWVSQVGHSLSKRFSSKLQGRVRSAKFLPWVLSLRPKRKGYSLRLLVTYSLKLHYPKQHLLATSSCGPLVLLLIWNEMCLSVSCMLDF